jgi:hypothetical protein
VGIGGSLPQKDSTVTIVGQTREGGTHGLLICSAVARD